MGSDFSQGILTWRFNLQANEAKVVKLGYHVRYPKEKRVSNLNRYRKMAAPAF
jgi:hypothetical protein